jgi:uncharacterized coiled-coil protein SlyX
MENIKSRVTDLEIQISHQIKMLDELNDVIIQQQKNLDKINVVNDFLMHNLRSTGNDPSSNNSNQIDQNPPHY